MKTDFRLIPVPCGKCPECVKSKINSWTFRIDKEIEVSTNPLFVTLTYNDENVPKVVDEDTGEILQTLRKRDVQLFLKRLRKSYAKFSSKQIRYYLVGEYGSKSRRPHYHAIILNLDKPELIQSAWGLGFDKSPMLRTGGISYVLKYISKPRAPKDARQPEFSLMSKGLGANYLTPRVVSYHRNNLATCYVSPKPRVRMAMPKYYKEKLYTEDERKAVTSILQVRSEKVVEERVASYLHRHPELSKEEALRNLDLSKLFATFEKRRETL